MSRVNIFLIKMNLAIIGIYLFQCCTNPPNDCYVQVESMLAKTDFLRKKKSFTIDKMPNGWTISAKNDAQILESRYAYKIETDIESGLILINHRQIKSNQISGTLEKAFLELIKKFEHESLDNIPNVGFQLIYNKNQEINAKQVAKTVCAFAESVEEIKMKYYAKAGIKQGKIDKLLQLRFSFFMIANH